MFHFFLLAAISLLVVGCGPNAYQSNSGTTLTGVDAITQLNVLEQSGITSISLHFDRIDNAVQLSVTSELGIDCVPTKPCPTPRPSASSDTIAGPGSLGGLAIGSTQLAQLYLAVSFVPTVENAVDCLAMAKDAESRGLQFNLSGVATLLPIPMSMAGGATSGSAGSGSAAPLSFSVPTDAPNGSATVYGNLISQANSVNQGLMVPPAFVQPWAGLVMRSISGCSEGGPITVHPPIACDADMPCANSLPSTP